MRRDLRILLSTVAVGAVALSWGPVSESVSSLEAFTVRDIEVRGIRYLTRDAVVERLALEPGTSVWVDRDPLQDRLLAHPLIRSATVSPKIPDGLLVEIEERRPIALAPTPTLEPIDGEGYRLPLDPAEHRLDLPVVSSDRTPPEGAALFPEDVRALAAELEHLMAADTLFLQRVSSVRRGERGEVVARWTEPPVDFVLPSMAPPDRLREGLGALAAALARTPLDAPSEVDLRFADQVVVRRNRE